MKELKQEATELGLDFKGNISKVELTNLIKEAKNVTAEDSSEQKVKVIITPRDSEEKEGYVRLNGFTAQYQFDTEIELPKIIVQFLKEKGSYVYGKNGKKWQSRFIVDVL